MFICDRDEPAAKISKVLIDLEIVRLKFFFDEGRSECVSAYAENLV